MSFGGSSSTSAKTTGTREKEDTSTAREQRGTSQLELDQTAIDKIVQDVLGGGNGLANIFGGEQTAGIFNSSVAAQASGDLAANLVGELAKLTGKTVTTGTETIEEQRRRKERENEFQLTAEVHAKT